MCVLKTPQILLLMTVFQRIFLLAVSILGPTVGCIIYSALTQPYPENASYRDWSD